MNAVQGEEITLNTTDPVKITLTDIKTTELLGFFIKVTVATSGVKAGIDSIAAGAKAWGTSDTVPVYSGYNGSLTVQGEATDKVVITAVRA
jgi:hypothetical protein